MDERQGRLAQNEALFRQVNEKVEGLNQAFGAVTRDFAIVCECGNQSCLEQVTLSREEYESARGNPEIFIVKPAHEVTEVEAVVARRSGYLLVRKLPGRGAELARALDERSDD
jgi:hypothetical protein